MAPDGINCFVACTEYRKETLARDSVAALQFETYLPQRLVWRTTNRRREQVWRPIFPGYLFVFFDVESDRYGPIKKARGINETQPFLCSGDSDRAPQYVPMAIIEALKKQEQMVMAKTGEFTSEYQIGDKFKLNVGRYASFEAEYIGEDKGMASVVINLFGRPFIETIPIVSLPAKEPAY